MLGKVLVDIKHNANPNHESSFDRTFGYELMQVVIQYLINCSQYNLYNSCIYSASNSLEYKNLTVLLLGLSSLILSEPFSMSCFCLGNAFAGYTDY